MEYIRESALGQVASGSPTFCQKGVLAIDLGSQSSFKLSLRTVRLENN